MLAGGVLLAWQIVHHGRAHNLLLLGLLLLAVVAERLPVPGDAIRRTETVTFALLVAAAGLHSVGGAAAVALVSLAAGAWFRPASSQVPLVTRAALLTGLIGAGWLLMRAPALTLVAFACLGLVVTLWLRERRSHARLAASLAGPLMLGWLVLMAALPLWTRLLPPDMVTLFDPAMAPLNFALGFMTLDTLIASGIGLRRAGWRGVRFWQAELPPTFARYNLMALAGAIATTAYAFWGVLGLGLACLVGGCALAGRRERVRAHRRLIATVCALSSALDARDAYTKGHSDRVAAYAVAIAERLGWPARKRRELELAAHLHDVGKIGVPDAVLLKPGKLTDDEFEAIKRHAQLSADIVRNVPEFRRIADIIRQHHERLDGSGYPSGLNGQQLLPAARILAVADSFDAMTSTRTYRPALASAEALRRLRQDSGRLYDERMVEALADLVCGEQLDVALQYAYCLVH